MLIRVSNIDRSTSLDDIWDLFAEFGEVEEAEINDMPDPEKFTFTGYVVMTYPAEAEEAIEELNGERIDGQVLSVKTVEAKEVLVVPDAELAEGDTKEIEADIEAEVDIPAPKTELRRKEVKGQSYRAD